MMNRLFLLLCILAGGTITVHAQKDSSKFELGVFYTPPGFTGENWRKTYTYVPYTIHTNRITGSYEIGASLNYHFAERWFLNARLSDYNAHLSQYTDTDVALLPPSEEHYHYTIYDVRCHVINVRTNLNVLLTAQQKFSISLLTGPLIRIPIIRNYQATAYSTYGNATDEGKFTDAPPFHIRLGGSSGLSFKYKLSKRLNFSADINIEYSRSILDKTALWGTPTGLRNHMQLALYFPFSIHYKL